MYSLFIRNLCILHVLLSKYCYIVLWPTVHRFVFALLLRFSFFGSQVQDGHGLHADAAADAPADGRKYEN